MRAQGPPRARAWPSRTRQLCVLLGLTGFAISQPLLGLLGDAPTVLARHGIEGRELVVLSVLVAFVPPLVVWIATALAGVLHLDRPLHLLAVGGLVGAFVVQVAKSLGLESPVGLLLTAAVAAAGFVLAYVRQPLVATWASYTAILPVLAVASFLLVSPASALLTSADAPERVAGGADLPSVVMVILDEMPTRSLLDEEDEIDRDRFPNLAAFGEDATWYRHASSLATLTEAAVPSMVTGMLPVAEEAVWTNHPDNLFTLLAPTHELEVIEQSSEMCPYEACAPSPGRDGGEALAALKVGGPGFRDLLGVARDLWVERVSLGEPAPQGFDDFDEAIAPSDPASATTTTVDPTAPSVTARPAVEDRVTPEEGQALTSLRTAAMVESFDARKGPALYYLHLMIPHQPFKRYPDGTEYGVVDPLGLGLPVEDSKVLFSWSPWVSAVSEQQHLLQAQYGDQLVGEVMAGLRDAGLYDDSLVIVASDHGISFEARTAGRYVEASTVDAIGYTPLLVKPPGQSAGATDDSNVMTYDVLPTIADILDIDLPWETDGDAVGSDTVAARGPEKRIYDMIGFGGLRVREIVEYDDAEAFRTVGDRSIGSLPDPGDDLSALHARLGLAELVGARLDDLVTGRGGAVGLHQLDALRRPDDLPLGLVTGDVQDADRLGGDVRLVLAVDGVVVGGSELSTDSDGRSGRIAVLLPPGALDADNDIRAALVRDGPDGREVVELEVGRP